MLVSLEIHIYGFWGKKGGLMSLFSYIALPREANMSMIENGISALNHYQIGELTWNKKEYRIERNTSGAGGEIINPDKLDGSGLFHGIRLLENNTSTTFNSCFKNRHIYILEGCLDYNGERTISDNSEFFSRLINSILVNIELCRKQLFDLIIQNLNKGEFAEIYSELVNHADFNIGPPLQEIALNANDILFSKELNLADRLKIEIKI
jgi:hypothetical protein